jgi:hypothetical protein
MYSKTVCITSLTAANFIWAILAVDLQVTVECSRDTLPSRSTLELIITARRTCDEQKTNEYRFLKEENQLTNCCSYPTPSVICTHINKISKSETELVEYTLQETHTSRSVYMFHVWNYWIDLCCIKLLTGYESVHTGTTNLPCLPHKSNYRHYLKK